ncbi:two-component system activity regulator YycH [Paenibacillus alvei]|uniref:Two-component system activity regulator YycH n=1 Tax=Paenibacillus alvei TaxID=44250 RepID=A0ABT4GRI3_PAEAL|nr:two-component system activity regulator YycH [Paenibacillus alvei]MCY9539958.1 two-component system activity regulator YycH [Paenibacillus alvei]MCY9707145.1 two-component system activity regulator YycH [Paenibacillus alvei]MCY9733384.1 two-component system activity regulator YycH [Paenibacillus alvei]MCY9753162.1 two-component system activity regulator YycH [Paenibacillus alvei]MCY9759295.1 two-component system activity regulator YycH [Paenibacillus alvei]
MIERIKTLLLTFLVLLSLLQSFFLAYSMPNFDVRKKFTSDYIMTDPLGPEEKVENLVFPEQLVLHLGGNKHTVLYPGMTFYNIIVKRLQGRSYDGFQYRSVSAVDWARIREENEGVELLFHAPIPVKLLQRVFPIGDDSVLMNESIRRIWLYTTKDTKEVRVFFFNAEGDAVYESTSANLTEQDVKQQVEFGRAWTPYKLVDGAYYVPEQPIEMQEVTLPFDRITAEQMQRSLFNDPTVTKNIETGNSEIYTDVKRGLEVNRGLQWLIYSDPVVQTEGQQDITSDVTAAVRFINQHGGWNGRYRVTMPDNMKRDSLNGAASELGTAIRFQQYWGSYPIVNTSRFRFGYMQVTMQEGTVTSYERSLVQLHQRAAKKEMRKLAIGDALIKKLKELSKEKPISAIDPVYVPILGKDTVRLLPAWQVKYKDGTTALLDEAAGK